MIGRLRRGGFTFNFVGNIKRWTIISGVMLLVSIASLAIRQVNLGLEFKGGTAIEVIEAKKTPSVEEMKKALQEIQIEQPLVQRQGANGFLIQTEHLGLELQQAAVAQVAKATGIETKDVSVTDVGPKWGAEITNKAVRGLIVFLLLVTLYITIRFEWKMAIIAIIAMIHDLILTAGIYSLTGIVVTPATLIAILTILGYSLYDTVIIFDRVKERTAGLSAAGRLTYSDVANQALNEVFVRSLNTSLSSLIPVGSLLFIGALWLGAETLEELALALFIGIAVGAYSSVFIAVPYLARWKERDPRWAALRARIAARGAEPTAARVVSRSQRGPAREDDEEAEERAAVTASPRPRPAATRPGARPPQRRRKRKRRR